jgi:GNAT superfamily N-acetyltransferase
VRIYGLDELPRALRPQLATFAVSDGDPPQDYALLQELRRRGHPASDYWGVYAVEDHRIHSRVETLWLPFTGREGPETVVGIADVLTLPTATGRGFARALLEEVHRRETTRGARWCFLWTHRTWGAHRLYQSLGYEDVYSSPNALRGIPATARRTPPSGYRWTTARARDADRLDRILATATSRRLGFVPRSRGSTRVRFHFEWRRPENHRILWHGRRAVGYAHLSSSSGRYLIVNEALVTAPDHLEGMIDGLEALARGRWLTFQGTSLVRDAEASLRDRGYLLVPSSHSVLMAKPLGPMPAGGEDLRAVFTDPRFSSHRGDMF